MRRTMLFMLAAVVAMTLSFTVSAKSTKVEKSTVTTPAGEETTIKVDSKKAKTEVTETVNKGEVTKATVVKEAKGTNPVLKKVVTFDSVSKDGMYITVVDRDQKIRYQTNDPKRPYVVKWKKMDPIEITATYDINAGKYVVDQTLIRPATQPMKEITSKDIEKALEKGAPKQIEEKTK